MGKYNNYNQKRDGQNQGNSIRDGRRERNNKDKKKEQKQKQIRQVIKKMSYYTFPVANVKGTSGKSILGANVNVASDNFDKTLQYIYGKIGLKVNATNHISVLEKMLDAYRKKKVWEETHLGEKKPGKESQYLLSKEQNEKMKTLLFHHFSVLAPILGSMESTEINEIKKDIEQGEANKSLTEEQTKEIIKKVKDVVKTANIDNCLEVLVSLSKALHYCRNIHSHYRAYNNREKQIEIFQFFANTAKYLTNALKASAIICQSNAGAKAKQYEFITGEYHYGENDEEYSNYYYRIKGMKRIRKANDKEEEQEYDAISDYGIVYLISLFLSKSDTETMLDQLEVFETSPFKDYFEMEKSVLTSVMSVYRINIPKGKRMKMEEDNVQLCMDMLNELQKCPQDLYDVMTQDGKDTFKREQMEPLRDSETGEYIREKYIKSEKGQQGQQKERSTDGTGNIVYQGKGVYSLLVRKEDRFPYFALRFIDNRNLFPTIRFQIDLGYYRFAFYPKLKIDGCEDTRILQKRINGFGQLVKTENARKSLWTGLFQESEMKNPNETETSEIARDEDGNIIEIEQLIKADANTPPFVTDKRANYNIHNNRIGLYWDTTNGNVQGDAIAPYIPELKTKTNSKGKVCPDVCIRTPLATLSVRDLPALIFYEYLRSEDNQLSAEKIIKGTYKEYKTFFEGIVNGKIKSWGDVKALEKKDIPEKFWAYLDKKPAGQQSERIVDNYLGKDVEDGSNCYHFKGHIQERIEYLENEIRKFNDICLKMVTTGNEYGTDDYKAFRPTSLALKMARSIMEWLPAVCPAKKIVTGVNYGAMSSALSQFGSDGKNISSLESMFIKGGIIAAPNASDADKIQYHPFLKDVLNNSVRNIENLYIEYVNREMEYVRMLQSELEIAIDKRSFIQDKLPFAKLTRKRFADRDDDYYRKLANRYLTIDNSENGGQDAPAIILLPDGLFTKHIFNLLQKKHPDIFTGNPMEDANNNASYLISTYFEKVVRDESQVFYQNILTPKKKNDSRYRRHYKFFDFFDDPKLLKENYPSGDNRKKKSAAYESKLYPKEINDKLKSIDRKAILNKVHEYIQLEEAKIDAYQRDREYNAARLEDAQKRTEKQWYVHSTTKNQDFLVRRDEEIRRLENKLKKLDLMILNSQQKIEVINETYEKKFISLKNECKHKERAIRRYRMEDIVTFFMVSTYFKEIFKDKPEEVTFKLQDVGNTTAEKTEGFLDKTVPFSRMISVTFARDEKDMLKPDWEKNDKIEKITMDCEVFLNRIAIRNYNLALTDLNDERLLTFLTHFACIHYLYGAKRGIPLRINYNRLSLEFKMYNQLRSDIFKEVHEIEKCIVDSHIAVLNNDKHRDFFIPMKDADLEKIKRGEKVVRRDEEAKRNSYVNLLAIVFDENNKNSVAAKNVRNSAAHNSYSLAFDDLANEKFLFKILRAYQLPDKMPHEVKNFDKEVDLDKKDPHSFAALILKRIKDIKKYLMREIQKQTS